MRLLRLVAGAALATLAACDLPASTVHPSTSVEEVSVLNFNLDNGLREEDPSHAPFDRLPERLPRISADLAALRPSLVMLQEVNETSTKGYPDVLGSLSSAMGSEYQSVFADSFGNPPVVNGGTGQGSLTMTRLQVLASDARLLTNVRPFEFHSILHVRVHSDSLGDVDTYNVQLAAPDDERLAETEISDILGFVEQTSGSGNVVFVAGDFGHPEQAQALQLLRNAGFSDMALGSGLSCTAADRSGCTASTYPLAEPGNRAFKRSDFIWVRSTRPMHATAAPVFNAPYPLDSTRVLWPSDHIGLFARALP